jgi:molecular chaperone GrpE
MLPDDQMSDTSVSENQTPDKTEATMSEPVTPATGDATGPQGVPAEMESASRDAALDGAPPDGGTPDGNPAGTGPGAATEPSGAATATVPLGAELEALRAELDERTSDLQRVSAEFANYRKRVERDRAAVVELATAQVVVALLSVLDDLDRAREHGDLTGPFGAMAEQLSATLAKFGLTGFGEVGDAFDPTRHEAVTHQTSAEVSVPTCVTVMRRGYLLGERLLRPALVAVADPESQ